ncbi:MAG: PepSY-associated TM helix domain-containing protein [Prevotella sp.]
MKKVFRKIHLWLSVPFGIIITLVCFSGATMVYEKEITEWCRHDLYFVKEVKGSPLPLDSLMRSVAATLPDSVSVTGVTVYPESGRAYSVALSKPRRAVVYVDQYTGEVKGRGERLPFFDTMFHLHRWLLGDSQSAGGGPSVGKLLVGCSALALVVILLTGILMWLTNRRKPLRKSLTISFTKGSHRFLHDLHVAGGIYATIFLLALALTGLTWSFSWYRSAFYAACGVETSEAEQGRHGHGGQPEGKGRGDRALEREGRGHGHQHEDSAAARPWHHRPDAVLADSAAGGQKNRHPHRGTDWHRSSRKPDMIADVRKDTVLILEGDPVPVPFAHWQEVYGHLAQTHPGFRQISISDGAATVVPEGRKSLRAGDTYNFDVFSGKIMGYKPYAEQDKATKVRSTVYMLHVGSWGGWFTRIITFLAALLGVTLPLTGYYLWLKRLTAKRPDGKP